MENHFKGIVPDERWKNDVLNELRQIRELLSRDAQTTKQDTEKNAEPTKERTKRTYQKRGDKQ